MTNPTSQFAELDPEAKRAVLAKLIQEQLSTSDVEAPLTYGQHAMWFLHELAPMSCAYNVAFTARVRSAINLDALRNVLQAVVDRHAPLRTTYVNRESKMVQIVHASQAATLEIMDTAECDDVALYDAVRAAYEKPFELEQGPVFRAHLFTRASDDHVLLLTAHHIAIDGWSIWTLLQELGVFYAAEITGQDIDLPPLAAQYLDYVRWEAELLAGSEGERLWDYWSERLGGELPILDLPTDRPRPTVQTFNGATVPFDFGGELGDRIRALARSERTTVYSVLLAAYQILLHRYSGQDDILVGSPMAGRSQPQFAGLVGDFINVVVLRADLSGSPTFRDFLAQVRETVLGALAHQDFPFALLVHRLAPKPDPSRSPIFQAVLKFLNIQSAIGLADLFVLGKTDARVDVGGLSLEPYPMAQQEGQIDLMLQVIDASGDLFGSFQYNTDLFDATTIELMVGHYRTLLEGLVVNPDLPIDELPMLTTNERRQIVVEWNATQANFPTDRCAYELIEEQVERTPDRVAVEFEGKQLTYQELNTLVNQLAHHLITLGVGPEVAVGIYMKRSLDMIVAVLAVHKAGGAYVPLDPSYPAERRRLMMEDASAAVVIINGSVALGPLFHLGDSERAGNPIQIVNLDADRATISVQPVANPARSSSVANLAYIVHTSGSTGRPKGIEIEHRSLSSFLHAFQRTPGMTSDDIMLARTTLSFDPSTVEIFLPLMIGARIVLISNEISGNGELLKHALNTSGATIAHIMPAHCRLLLAAGWEGTPGLKLLSAGEPLTRDLAKELLPRVDELWNIYGPTETTVWATAARIMDEEAISIGRPLSNVQVYILDRWHQPTPVGIVGELHIGGPFVARGYRNRPDLTEQSFITIDPRLLTSGEHFSPDMLDGTGLLRLYRTGDHARYRRDGTIELLGRADNQVKVRGFRIEPGEIEVALAEVNGVRAAVVMVCEDTPGDQRLVAYIQPEEGATPSPATLRRQLREVLPSYMVPSMFILLDNFPLTPTGKVDRQALPVPELQRSNIDERYSPPQSPTERMVAKLWCDALGIDRAGVYDNFFDLGGYSLKLVESLAAIEQQIGVRLNPAYVQTQTLGQLAAICDEMIARGEIRQPKPARSRTGNVVRAMRRMLGTES